LNQNINELLHERILILDGAMGTMIQGFELKEEDYRGERFADIPALLKGNNDLLSLTRPELIKNIHRQYVEAGADIISTNTFNANAISMEEYGIQSFVYEMNVASGRLAREVAEEVMSGNPGRKIFVAGSLGPTNKTTSISPDVNRPAYRSVSYMDMYRAYQEQARGLIEGGVDILLFETVFDTLNVKAGLEAAVELLHEKGLDIPIFLSITLSGKSGRTLSGQTLKAVLASVQHIPLTCIGLNCSFGASDMKPFLKELADNAPYFICAYPNAGLPNQFGQYDETPESMAKQMKEFVDEGLVNIIGGCCGTTPAHIARYQALTAGKRPHQPLGKVIDNQPDFNQNLVSSVSNKPTLPSDTRLPTNVLWLSGLELLEVKPENNFINIGERCNVAGSRKFLRLIAEKKYEESLTIARKQVEDGAQIIDINMDDGMLDAVQEMQTFLQILASDPDISRVPLMIDSSKWEVIENGLMCVQGKSIVNSISLKEGEALFLANAQRIRQLGAAAIVMAFDEQGQADTFERKKAVCERAYKLLTERIGFPPNDIIFDPNVLAIATGMSEHNGYGLDFILAVAWIKQHLPGAKVSGGVSNLSFSFRGNNYVREAMHAVFLYHAIRAGMDMGIVNPSSSVMYDDIDPSFRNLLEDVILARRPEAAEELIAHALEISENQSKETNGTQTGAQGSKDNWRTFTLEERLEYALVKGISDFMVTDLEEALTLYDKPVQIIDGPLMNGMNKVGELFGEGKMFLPQVVKTARTMKKAVEILQPYIERDKSATGASKAGKMVFATVKGDIHDIGKNIVSIVLNCNNYEVIDLGVMVPAEKILETVLREKPDFLCLSGLITPSLEEMIHVTKTMQQAGQTIPIMIGGATTSKIHTALKIAPHYDYPVIHAVDASQNPLIAARLLNPLTSAQYIEDIKKEYERLRATAGKKKETLVSLSEARSKRFVTDWASYIPDIPKQKGVHDIIIPAAELIPYINWTYFLTAWGMFRKPVATSAEEKQTPSSNHPVRDELMEDAHEILDVLSNTPTYCIKARYGFFEAVSDGDDILLANDRIPLLRQQQVNESDVYSSLSDYIMPISEGRTDYIGAFVVTAGRGCESLDKQYEEENDTYRQLLLQTLLDRLTEASSEYLHLLVRKEFWGYAADESCSISELLKSRYRGIRPAIGYPSLPDQEMIFTLDKLLQFNKAEVELTENGAMFPSASAAGIYFAHPDSRYFMIGRISDEQLRDYAVRRNAPVEEIRKFLSKNAPEE
jgi:5-methyltetrahydrofolate--homocysteine methyltransferase